MEADIRRYEDSFTHIRSSSWSRRHRWRAKNVRRDELDGLTSIQSKYVEHVPDQLKEGIPYIRERFRICSHFCACGCKEEVVTPLSKAEWHLTRDGHLLTIDPSIGNGNYDCESHYCIEENRSSWVHKMRAHGVKRVQQRDAIDL